MSHRNPVASNVALVKLLKTPEVREHFYEALIQYIEIHGMNMTQRDIIEEVAADAVHHATVAFQKKAEGQGLEP